MLNDATLQKIKLHYTEEYQKTLVKLKELEGVLSQLNEVQVSYQVPSASLLDAIPEGAAIPNTVKEQEASTVQEKAPKRNYKKRAKKRGRKSLWGDFVLKRLKSTQKPLSYDDLANHAIVMMKLDQKDFNKIRKSIIGAVFSLRTKQDKVVTVPQEGSRDKYVLLKGWVDERENMLPEFKEKL